MARRLLAILTCVVVVGGLAATMWLHSTASGLEEAPPAEMPTPPFPPRIAEGSDYEACLTALVTDREGAAAVADGSQSGGTGEGAAHCRGLALIASGRAEQGAAMLETLARQSVAPALARASVLGQAGQARLMVPQADQAVADASLALTLAPQDTDLLILRATAEGMLGRLQAATDDLSSALILDPGRGDALVARAGMYRKLDQLDQARADVERVLSQDRDDPDALLERGILRQRMGDAVGARADWERARAVDPSSTTADLAAQNVSLLDAGPLR